MTDRGEEERKNKKQVSHIEMSSQNNGGLISRAAPACCLMLLKAR